MIWWVFYYRMVFCKVEGCVQIFLELIGIVYYGDIFCEYLYIFSVRSCVDDYL